MANRTNQRPPQAANTTPLQEAARPRGHIEYDIPDADGMLDDAVTASFGAIRTIEIRLLTPLQEKDCAADSKEPMMLAFELAKRSIAAVVNDQGQRIEVRHHDGSDDELWGQLHPKLRALVMQAYAENNNPTAQAAASFMASRRIRA